MGLNCGFGDGKLGCAWVGACVVHVGGDDDVVMMFGGGAGGGVKNACVYYLDC